MAKGKYIQSTLHSKKTDNIYVNFTDAFSKMEDDFRESLEEAVLSGFQEMVQGTPIDTGRAKASWSVALGNRIPRKKPAGNYVGQESKTINNGKRQIKRFIRKGLEKMTIVNTAPYIEPLERGHSSQNQYWIRAASKRISSRIGRKMRGGTN